MEIVSDFAGHPFEIVRALIHAANAAGGKDNVTVVYVEGPRFAEGEDTRDLRHRRLSRIEDGDLPVSASGPVPVRGIDKDKRRRWRWVALIALLLVVAGTAAYFQRDRLPVNRLMRLWTNASSGVLTTSSTIHVASGQSIATALAAAGPGSEILVEPGEYRQQIQLKSGVRVTSRVPRGATLRLPVGVPTAKGEPRPATPMLPAHPCYHRRRSA